MKGRRLGGSFKTRCRIPNEWCSRFQSLFQILRGQVRVPRYAIEEQRYNIVCWLR